MAHMSRRLFVAAGALVLAACSESSAPPLTAPRGNLPVSSVVVTLSLNDGTRINAVPGLMLNLGATFLMNATTRDARGNVLTGHVVTWASSNTAVATVSETGVLTCVSPGSATITATSEGVTGTVEFAVADLSWLG
jgi:hypothetical protein